MLKRIKQAASSKKGESYIYLCVLVLFISMLVSVVIMYMGLTLVFCFDYYRHAPAKNNSRTMLAAFIIAIALGGIIEIVQEAMHMGRTGDFYDFIADAVGAAIGMGLGLWIIKPFLLSR